MSAADEADQLPEVEDEEMLSCEDLLRDASSGCLFCQLGELGEGEDD